MIVSEQIKIKIKDVEKRILIAKEILKIKPVETNQDYAYWEMELPKLELILGQLLKELLQALELEAKEIQNEKNKKVKTNGKEN
jgi:hypothetical protein